MTMPPEPPLVPSPQQQAIIDHGLEPLLVDAGAGTGKTTTMALRLARLIEAGSIEPEQALGITFTRKATRELANRIASLLPDLTAEGRAVEVTTYHGFAHGLLDEFGPMVGVERDARLVTPGYVRQLMRDALSVGRYDAIDLTAPAHRVADLVRLDGQLGDHLAGPELLMTNVFATSPVDEQRRELAATLVHYREIKRRLGVVDYADLIRLAQHLITQHPDIAERIRDRFRVVLLDEYQDTNPAQRRLFVALFGDGFPVTAVGDPDQTIYEWRGASLANFVAFPADFASDAATPAPVLPLTLNRRSGQRILDMANLVRQRIEGNDAARSLVAADEADPGEIHVAWFRTPEQEARWIADEVRRLHDEEGVPWSEIAVLFRRNSSIAAVRDALEAREVPVEVASLGGLLFVPEVADVHSWLRLIGRPDDAPALVRILTGAHYRLGLGDLAPLAAWVRRQRHADDGLPRTLLEAVEHLDDIDGLGPEARRSLGRFAAAYRELLEAAQSTTLVELCRRILGRLGFWVEVASLSGAARLSARLNLYRFLDLAEEWSPLVGRPSLDAFLDYLELLLEDDTSEELDTAQLSTEEAVALLTVHRAKGLEWHAVFIPAACKGVFPVEGRPLDNPVTAPSRLPYAYRTDADDLRRLEHDDKALRARLRAHSLDQEWRVAYVAVTRARRHLAVSGAHWHSPKIPKEPSDLFRLAADLPATITHHIEEEPGSPPGAGELQPPARTPAPDPHFPDGWQSLLRMAATDLKAVQRLGSDLGPAYDAHVDQLRMVLDGLPAAPDTTSDDTFVTSVTALVTLASCPKRYYWSEVDRLPRRPAEWLQRGVDLHRRIELHNLGQMPLEEVSEAAYDAVVIEPGEPAATAYATFLDSRFAASRPVFVEVPIDVRLDQGRVRGRIDAVYAPEPDLWEIVDYKSGRHREDAARRVQLQAYAVAARSGALPAAAPDRIEVTFAFFGGGAPEEVTEIVDEAWLEQARADLDTLIEQARSDAFAATPSPSCRNCDFASFCPEGTAYLAGDPSPTG